MIRDYKSSDLESRINIWYQENITAHSFIKKEYWEKNYKLVKNAIPAAKIFVYEQNGEIIGFIGITGNYIAGIFVKQQYHNCGIGTLLIKKAKEVIPGLYLNVYLKNKSAVKFYKRHGFTIIKTLRNYETLEKEHVMFWKPSLRRKKINPYRRIAAVVNNSGWREKA